MSDHITALRDALAGRYVLERELGRGGMATVYLARDIRHDRPVALKVLHPDLAVTLGTERFQREIHVAARLQHPHILTVLDSGEAAGQFWFTMPYVEGESLRQRLEREIQLPVEEAVRIARDAAQALQYAHEHDVVHRDIKPENLLLTADGNTLVADFGIARALGASESERLTQTGTSLGTAAYMSPEQAAGGREVDARSDIYSLGIVLYEMLAGETPFAAPTPQATIARRFTDDPAPLQRGRPAVPPHVDAAVQRALARTAADRFSTARAFSDALATSPAAPTISAPTAAASPMERMRRAPGFAALIIGLLIGGGVLFAWTRVGTEAPATAEMRAASVEESAVRIAVLPFENLGDTADGYFADGVTDAVRGKLADIEGVEVIARASSEEYRSTAKPQPQIADELGVHYLLTGTVRWVKQPDGTSRVQVSPELVEIGDGTARTRWGRPYNAPLTDVFEVQSQIAGQVSEALDVELGASERRELAERPTRNLAAYDAYLQAGAITGNDSPSLKRATAYLEQAVALDSSFGLAWAQLAGTRAWLAGDPTAAIRPEHVEQALARAMALAPEAPLTYRARVNYQLMIRHDEDAARTIAEEGLARHPARPELLRALGSAYIRSGELTGAVAVLSRAAVLDPRDVRTTRVFGIALRRAGRHAEARAAFERALVLAPDDLAATEELAVTHLAEGDLSAARRVLNAARTKGGRAVLMGDLAVFGDFYWVFDRAQQDTILELPIEYFGNDAGSRALVFTQILHQRGDTSGVRRWADSARRGFEVLAGESVDPQVDALVGLALAYQGRHTEARRWLERAVAESRGTIVEPYALELLGRSLVLAGRYDEAVEPLEKMFQLPGAPSPALIRLTPVFAPLVGNPRFERLTRQPA